MAELLRRLNWPTVELAPLEVASRAQYLQALRAADNLDWKPLITVWEIRLTK